MDDDVVGGLNGLPCHLFGEDGDAAVCFVSGQPTVAVFARELPSPGSRRCCVAVAGGVAEVLTLAVSSSTPAQLHSLGCRSRGGTADGAPGWAYGKNGRTAFAIPIPTSSCHKNASPSTRLGNSAIQRLHTGRSGR